MFDLYIYLVNAARTKHKTMIYEFIPIPYSVTLSEILVNYVSGC